MPGTIRRMAGYYGQVVGTDDWDNAFGGVENTIERAALATLGTSPGITSPPAISNLGTDTLNIGPWSGYGYENGMPYPVFQTGSAVGVNFGDATHGSLLGDVNVTADGEYRMVVLLARYATVDDQAVVDDNSVADFVLLRHAISYRVIMGNQSATQDATLLPPDLESEIAAGSIPLLGILRTRTGGVQGNTVKALAYSHKGRSIADEMRLKSMLTEGSLVRFPDDPYVDAPEYKLTASEMVFVANPTQYEARMIPGNRWAALVDGELITSDMITPGETFLQGDTQLPASGTRYVVLDWERQPYGVLRPRILLYPTIHEVQNGVILAVAVTSGGAPTVTFAERPPMRQEAVHIEVSADQTDTISNTHTLMQDGFDNLVYVRSNDIAHSTPDAEVTLPSGVWKVTLCLSISGDAAGPDIDIRLFCGGWGYDKTLPALLDTDTEHVNLTGVFNLIAPATLQATIRASSGTPTVTYLEGSTLTAERLA